MAVNGSKFKLIVFEEIEPKVGLVTLNRPASLNAINIEMAYELHELYRRLSAEDSIRVLILTGKGRGFSSGADLSAMASYKDKGLLNDPYTYLKVAQETYSGLIIGLRRIPQPIIAAVNGPCAGIAFSMILGCDIRIAAPEAYFVASFANIGLSAGEGGTSYLLPRLIGVSRAAEVLYTGRKFMADEAERSGLVSKIVPREQLIETALSYARQMLSKSAGGLQLTKQVLDQSLTAPSLEAAIELENRNQTMMVFSKDFIEAVMAFVGKDKERK